MHICFYHCFMAHFVVIHVTDGCQWQYIKWGHVKNGAVRSVKMHLIISCIHLHEYVYLSIFSTPLFIADYHLSGLEYFFEKQQQYNTFWVIFRFQIKKKSMYSVHTWTVLNLLNLLLSIFTLFLYIYISAYKFSFHFGNFIYMYFSIFSQKLVQYMYWSIQTVMRSYPSNL